MSSLEPDQPQAQVPVAVEGDREPQGQLMNSTSGAAYELETSGDGEARQMAVGTSPSHCGLMCGLAGSVNNIRVAFKLVHYSHIMF